jgi:hypothetical protein
MWHCVVKNNFDSALTKYERLAVGGADRAEAILVARSVVGTPSRQGHAPVGNKSKRRHVFLDMVPFKETFAMAPKSKAQATHAVDRQMIDPPGCFVTFKNSAVGWAPLHGTGCAHYVAHELGIRRGKKGLAACDLGFCIKVPMLVEGMSIVPPSHVQISDIWVNHAKNHCGFVVMIERTDSAGGLPKITISQCSSNRKAGRLGVNSQDWATFFGGHGAFYRPVITTARL